ncbi:MAG: DNA polymerase III subunit gamma/tau [Firmicutes bacterium]|nr:DNA polymerase III subunit gamma/tau [Bacillota bacterium]
MSYTVFVAHTALYRKYRPVSFEGCKGQEAIKITLQNQIIADRVGHAYLFTGSRGTGKTTFARIFAKAINCIDNKGGNACNKCPPCIALDEPTNLDILEIDAASNNKVDEIREIRERVKYLPTAGRFKVYIIDEVHMLTESAFNALLKTLEEPPNHVVFILATTEVHKLPATILSRCMRFDFKLVSVRELIELLGEVLKNEGVNAELGALGAIARAGAGSFRDALSILDMCLHYTKGKLTHDTVLKILGAPETEAIVKVVEAIADRDVASSIRAVNSLISGGKTVPLVAKEVASFSRDCLAIKSGLEALVLASGDDIDLMRELAEKLSVELLIYLVDEFSRIDLDLKYSINPRILLEAVVLKAAMLSDEKSMLALLARVESLEGLVSGGNAVVAGAGINRPNNTDADLPVATQADDQKITLPVQKIGTIAKQAIAEDAKSIWGRLVTNARKKNNMQLYAMLSEHSKFSLSGRELIILTDSDNYLKFADEKTITSIKEILTEIGAPITTIRIDKQQGTLDIDADIAKLEKSTGIKAKVVRK